MKSRKLLVAFITSLSLCLALLAVYPLVGKEGDKAAADPALERTRKQVRMLDTIYKGSIVLVTKQYVSDKQEVPAGTLFKQIFALAKEKGFHEVRLLDATGEPYNDENLPRDEFEKKAIAALKSGQDWYELEIEKDGKRMLRVATPIPVVMEQCIACHDNYRDAKKGEAIGALGYTLPIE